MLIYLHFFWHTLCTPWLGAEFNFVFRSYLALPDVHFSIPRPCRSRPRIPIGKSIYRFPHRYDPTVIYVRLAKNQFTCACCHIKLPLSFWNDCIMEHLNELGQEAQLLFNCLDLNAVFTLQKINI